MAHEKTLTNKKPMKMPWNKMKPTMFFSWLFNDNEKAMNWKAIFHGVRIYGVFIGVFKFMPHKKKPWVFRERLNVIFFSFAKVMINNFLLLIIIRPSCPLIESVIIQCCTAVLVIKQIGLLLHSCLMLLNTCTCMIAD